MKRRDAAALKEFSQLAENVASSVKSRVADTRQRRKAVTSDRCRRRFSFWLEMNKVEQFDLWEWFTELKGRREFAPVIRTAVSLYRELLVGETAMLYQLFPDLKPTPPPVPPEKIKEMEQEINKLRIEVDILQQVIVGLKLPTEIDNAVKMSAPVHTPRAQVYKPSMTAPPPVGEVDTSSAFLDAF